MTIEYIRYRIADGDRATFEEAYRRAAVPLAAAPQCVDYELAHSEEDPQNYILRIRWTSTEDHVTGFRRGEHFAAFFAAIRPYVSAIEEMHHYQLTDVVGQGAAPLAR